MIFSKKIYNSLFTSFVKLTIVGLAFYIIISKVSEAPNVSINIKSYELLLIIPLSFLNWFFEILKWQKLTSVLFPIQLKYAAIQCISSHTAGIITPNKIGEYGAKAMFYPKKAKKKIIALTFIRNFYQMLTTFVFGFFSLLFVLPKVPRLEHNFSAYIFIIVSGILLYLFRNKTPFPKFVKFFKKMPIATHIQVSLFSIIRYLLFSHQFYFLLLFFSVNIDYSTALLSIFSMYFISSIIPSLAIFDFVIKGSVALWVFELMGVNNLNIVTISFLMWGLNFAIPAIIGSYFILKFNIKNIVQV